MELSFADLQRLVETQYSIEDTRKDLNDIVKYFRGLEYQKVVLDEYLVKRRQIKPEIVDECEAFLCDYYMTVSDLPEEFRSEALGLVVRNHMVFKGRILYPVKDVMGDVMGFCGWDNTESPKYLDSKNHGYKAKATSLFGMENLRDYYNSNEPVIVTEGIVCSLFFRGEKFQSLAALGSNLTPYVVQILRRFGDRLIVFPDNDSFGKSVEELDEQTSGEHFVQQAKRLLPKARIIQSVIAKDPDDTRKVEDGKYKEQFLDEIRSLSNPFRKREIIRIR